jgi:hypothetical protein
MSVSYNDWKKLFLFCLGLAIAASLCMKWMEVDFWAGNSRFTIMELELFYEKEKVIEILGSLHPHVKRILIYHLYFDFVFMAGVFPATAALCIMARQRLLRRQVRRFLLALAALQLLAWGCDIIENYYLLKWVKASSITADFVFFHSLVITKFIIVLTGLCISISIMLVKFKRRVG